MKAKIGQILYFFGRTRVKNFKNQKNKLFTVKSE